MAGMKGRTSLHRWSAVIALLQAAVLCLGAAETPGANQSSSKIKTKRHPADANWRDYPVHPLSSQRGFKAEPVELSPYGGWLTNKVKATGFFRVEKAGERWWLVDPDGCLLVRMGINTIRAGSTSNSAPAFAEKFGSTNRWAEAETERLRGFGFNGAGYRSDFAALAEAKAPLAMTMEVSRQVKGQTVEGFMHAFGALNNIITKSSLGRSEYPADCIPVFHPGFEAYCDEMARPLAAWKDKPWVVGYFSDHELPMPRLERYLRLKPTDPFMGSSAKAAKDWLFKRTKKENPVLTEDDREDWVEFVYARYFAVTTAAIRKYDPHHLCLGSRFYGAEKGKPAAFKAAGRYLDVVSMSQFRLWELDPQATRRWSEWSGKPILLSGFYVKGMDADLPNTSGLGWVVPTQRDRGLFYQSFVIALLKARNCIGWEWARYMDNDPADPNADPTNRDANKGIVNLRYEPYVPLVELMQELNGTVYPLTRYLDSR